MFSAQLTLHVTLAYRTQVEKFTENTATHFSVFALYFGNTVGWDFQKALICKHSLNHKSTCDQSDCSMHSPTNTAILCFIRCPDTFDRQLLELMSLELYH